MAATKGERFERCGTCGEVRHPYLFPFADPAANTYAYPPRTDGPKATAAYAKRQAEAARIRREAQAHGRDTSVCLLCASEAGNE